MSMIKIHGKTGLHPEKAATDPIVYLFVSRERAAMIPWPASSAANGSSFFASFAEQSD
jgi:hypothetical protein